jgi:hypothetical protein
MPTLALISRGWFLVGLSVNLGQTTGKTRGQQSATQAGEYMFRFFPLSI